MQPCSLIVSFHFISSFEMSHLFISRHNSSGEENWINSRLLTKKRFTSVLKVNWANSRIRSIFSSPEAVAYSYAKSMSWHPPQLSHSIQIT